MSIIKKSLQKIGYLIMNLIVVLISFLIPKTNKIVIVGGWFGQRFADNSKYLYLYLNEYKKTFDFEKIIWITKSKKIRNELKKNGYQVYLTWSLPSLWYHLRAEFHFIDQSSEDINGFFSTRSKRINLWHGFPLKKIGSFMEVSPFNKKIKSHKLLYKFTSKGFWSDHYLLATSNFASDILGKAFEVKDEKIIISGYPRNYLFNSEKPIMFIQEQEKDAYDRIQKYKNENFTIIGYFPTFRDKTETLIFGTKSLEEINDFLNFCEIRKIKIVGKFHFAGKNDVFYNVQDHKAFINLTSDSDVYTFIEQLDVLITDYSSIYFDFLLLNKPIIFYPYDLKYYCDEDRGLIFDYNEYTPGPKAYSIRELKEILSKDIKKFNLEYKNEYKKSAEILKMRILDNHQEMDIEYFINQFKNIGK